jgi:hypothetical protein
MASVPKRCCSSTRDSPRDAIPRLITVALGYIQQPLLTRHGVGASRQDAGSEQSASIATTREQPNGSRLDSSGTGKAKRSRPGLDFLATPPEIDRAATTLGQQRADRPGSRSLVQAPTCERRGAARVCDRSPGKRSVCPPEARTSVRAMKLPQRPYKSCVSHRRLAP